MVVYLPEGDIFNIEGVTNFAHGCNCAGAMGKGIALAFRNKYPDMYYLYKEYCRCGHFKPGTVFIHFSKGLHTKEGVIFNLGTQRSWKTGATLEYIRNSLIAMVTMAQDLDIRKIAMPAIGAGLGGLLWSDVKSVIDDVAKDIPSEKLTLFVVEKYSSSKKINV